MPSAAEDDVGGERGGAEPWQCGGGRSATRGGTSHRLAAGGPSDSRTSTPQHFQHMRGHRSTPEHMCHGQPCRRGAGSGTGRGQRRHGRARGRTQCWQSGHRQHRQQRPEARGRGPGWGTASATSGPRPWSGIGAAEHQSCGRTAGKWRRRPERELGQRLHDSAVLRGLDWARLATSYTPAACAHMWPSHCQTRGRDGPSCPAVPPSSRPAVQPSIHLFSVEQPASACASRIRPC